MKNTLKFIIAFFILIFFVLVGFGVISHLSFYSQWYLTKQYALLRKLHLTKYSEAYKDYCHDRIMSATEGLAKHRGSFISRYRSIPFEWQDDIDLERAQRAQHGADHRRICGQGLRRVQRRRGGLRDRGA